MTKHYRKCGLCSLDTNTDPNLVIFTASDLIKQSLNQPLGVPLMICEKHFDDSDMRAHGTSKRLKAGAVPIILRDEISVTQEHNYFPSPTCPLQLVR